MNNTENDTSSTSNKSERQPYVKPDVVSSEVFETMALSCANGPECIGLGDGERS